jgi:4,5-dihydroxyphthalate decarboxylase
LAITLITDHEFAAAYIADGRVKVEGFDVEPTWPAEGGGSLYAGAFTGLGLDIISLPLTNFLIAKGQRRPIVGLPVFPDVFFPHVGAQINKSSGISSVKDLEGKRVGVRGWGFSPGTWLRGALADVYDLDLTKVNWVEAEPNSLMAADYPRPSKFNITKGGEQAAELESGALDAVFYDRAGPEPTDNVMHLFSDPLGEALKYNKQTGIFPVNIVLVAKGETLEANPGLAQAVVDASDKARDLYYQNVSDGDEHMTLPVKWLRDTRLFPHLNGLENNRVALEAIIRYSHDLGLISRQIDPAELFFEGAK